MSNYFFDGIIPNYRNNNNTTNIKLDTANNQITIENTNINKTITINSEEFSNGIQTLPYTQMYAKINAVEACIYPPTSSNILTVNDTIILDNGSGSIDTITTNTITLSGAGIGGPTNTVSQGDMTIQDNTATNVSQITADYVQFTTPSYYSYQDATNLLIRDSSFTVINQLTNNQHIMTDGPGNIQLELTNDTSIYTEPTIRMQNNTGLNNYINFSGINADGHFNFNFNNNEKFFKLNNPFSYNIYNANDGDYIEKNYPYVLADNITVLKLYNPNNYLDDAGNPGWTCMISNLSSSDIQIDTAGFQWFAHSNGLNSSPIILKKWTTCNLTLLYSSSTVGDYVWALF